MQPPQQPTIPTFHQQDPRDRAAAYEPYRHQQIRSPASPPQSRNHGYRSPPPPPVHQQRGYPSDQRHQYNPAAVGMATQNELNNTTPGADNYSAPDGGLSGVARRVADDRPRESGVEATRNMPPMGMDGRPLPAGAGMPVVSPFADREPTVPTFGDEPYRGPDSRGRSPYHDDYRGPPPPQHGRGPMMAAGGLAVPGAIMAGSGANSQRAYNDGQGYGNGQYYDPSPQDRVLNRYSQPVDPSWQLNDPNSIADDGDDGLNYRQPNTNRGSLLSLGGKSRSSDQGSNTNVPLAAGAALGGAAALGAGGLAAGGPMYNQGSQMSQAALSMNSAGNSDRGAAAWAANQREKGELAAALKAKKTKKMWIIVAVLAVIILGAVGGAVAGVMISKNKGESGGGGGASGGQAAGSGGSADADLEENGDLSINSKEIKAMMGRKELKKVFPGMDYTPMYTQYPDCVHYPPSQNNITRDIAVISQLTNVVRLYGTDCNQTEMVLHAIDRLELKDEMKVWMGVWLDGNETTNSRQLEQMYTALNDYDHSYFAGIIIGNEVLFREEMSVYELGQVVADVKTNFSEMDPPISLPIATSDLGDAWTQELADVVDIVMANVHAFFTGKPVAVAAEFTWQFWQWQNWPLKPSLKQNIIAEAGWPTKGGMNCGYEEDAPLTCPDGSVASVDGLNEFLEDWVCPALANGTNYFFFEAFDEPWKIKFNTKGKEWEDQWGLMDVNRKLKPGVVIPDCGGKRIDKSHWDLGKRNALYDVRGERKKRSWTPSWLA